LYEAFLKYKTVYIDTEKIFKMDYCTYSAFDNELK